MNGTPVGEIANLVYTVPLTRTDAVVTRGDQFHPAAALVSPDASEATVALTADFYGGYAEADVPIHCVINANQNQDGGTAETRKGTSGAAVVAISADDDEQAATGITPAEVRAEVREDAFGLLRKRVIDGAGAESWQVV